MKTDVLVIKNPSPKLLEFVRELRRNKEIELEDMKKYFKK